jgi:heme exporter protein CcmD
MRSKSPVAGWGVVVIEWLAMGGYGAYVWSAFVLTVGLLLGLFWQSRRLARRREAELADLRGRLREARPRPAPRLIVERDTVGADRAPGSV